MKLILQLLFVLFINLGFSQDYREASIIFNDSSSIQGFAEIKDNAIYFKVKQEDKADKWSYDFVKGLVFSGYGYSEKYEYVEFEHSKPKLLQVVEEGNVNLYRYAKAHYRGRNTNLPIGKLPSDEDIVWTMSEAFYVKRKSELYAIDIEFSFNLRAKKYFGDCKKVVERINNKKFTKENIKDMVFFYNEYCASDDE
ncbi:hypothetical protein [Flavobacterium ginsenosidimutans]|uniref:hypothetical protein n=1 Tax=Flavobacterium ginsenosidimutans TaxID=687844 RepID=UPI000DAC89D7|nr:hypothetical protein [Flavobacterium ginsenosidimutans]KAF2326833.1 hypothetical protein DM444_23435 [Flavobacterium ginsenosidimutans]